MAEAAFATDTVVLAVGELVDERVIRSDPNRTIVPGAVVDYVLEDPYGSHPSYAQGYYDRDDTAYLDGDLVGGRRPSGGHPRRGRAPRSSRACTRGVSRLA